jgi:hypothetical protein
MGKASQKRKNERQRYLSRLARENPQKFSVEWVKRLYSWSLDADRNAKTLTDGEGNPTPSTFSFVTMAMEELKACGQEAVEIEGSSTMETMTNACCNAVAIAVDPRLCRLSILYKK